MFRLITELDKLIITEWISRDPDHAAKGMTEAFFRQPDSLNFAIDDKHGPIMYVRIEPLNADVVRLHIQFNEGERRRTAVALAYDFPIVRARLIDSGTKYIIFDSESEALTQFCQKRLGFVHISDSTEYFLDLKAG